MSLLKGLIFIDSGNTSDSTQATFNTHVGAVTLVAVQSLFLSAAQSLFEFPSQRPLFLREYATGTYTAANYFFSKSIIEITLIFVQIFVQFTILYFLISFRANFFLFVLIAWGIGVASSSTAILFSVCVNDVRTAAQYQALLFTPQILFVGFFIRITQIPFWLRWAQYCKFNLFHKYTC